LENETFRNNLLDYIPIWINLTRIKDPINSLIKEFFYDDNSFIKEELEEIKGEKILFILDGFDEINIMQNIYDNNKLNEFSKSKVLINCGEEYFDSINVNLNYTHIFSPNKNRDLLQLYYLREFNKNDKEIFIDKILKLKEKIKDNNFLDWNKDKILKEFNNIDNKSEYSNNPFNLNLLCSIIPKLKNIKNN